MSSAASGINQRSQPMTTHPPESRTCTDPRTGFAQVCEVKLAAEED
jgi:hypothetical protein